MKLFAILAFCLVAGASATPFVGRRLYSTAACEAAKGSCSLAADCDLASNVFRGRCDDINSGCCVPKDEVCAVMNGECLSEEECSAKSDCHANRIGCSSGVCCVQGIMSPRYGGDGTRQGNGRMNGGRMGRGQGGRMMVSSSAACEAVNGTCSLPADCDLASNVFRGRCDDTNSGCCVPKDKVCAKMNGECLSEDECNAKSDCHANRIGCSSGVCCVSMRASPRNVNGPGMGRRGSRREQRPRYNF